MVNSELIARSSGVRRGHYCGSFEGPGGAPNAQALPSNRMIYDVLVVSDVVGERRFTTEREAAFTTGDTFEQDSESYRVLAIHPGYGPLDGVIEAEWLASSEPGAPA